MKNKKNLVVIFLVLLIGVRVMLHLPILSEQKAKIVSEKDFGVNISGGEFQQAMYTDKKYTGYRYFHSKGLTLLRIPFKWETIQPTPMGELDTKQLASYTGMITVAQKAGEKVIIEPHNFGRYNNIPLTDKDNNSFSDLWKKLAAIYKGYSGIWGYELMNEPHDIPGNCETWRTLSQAGINAIRSEDITHYILVPGYSWQSASDWQRESDCLKNLSDPENKLLYSAHEYFDEIKAERTIVPVQIQI